MNKGFEMYAPICLFAYNRIVEITQTVEALRRNPLAPQSELYIFADGPKDEEDRRRVEEVAAFLASVDGFKRIIITRSPVNKGLARSIIEGVTQVVNNHGKVIVLEDDLLTSENFLDFMNGALNFYKDNSRIFSVSGWTMPLRLTGNLKNKDYYYFIRGSSWGWATWSDRWALVDWEIKDFPEFLNSKARQRSFNAGGSDLTGMLKNQMSGRINSWAIRWCYNQWKHQQLTVYPTVSKINNLGFNQKASNTRHRIKEYETLLDGGSQRSFSFSHNVMVEPEVISTFQHTFSITVRIKNKILKMLRP